MKAPLLFLLVAAGGAIGSVLRYALTMWSVAAIGSGFPWHTAFINVAGSFAIGMVAVYAQSSIGASPAMSAFAIVGVLGGFTTFSTFSYDTVTLISDGAPALALAYCAGSVAAGVAAAIVGMSLARVALHAG